jgi:hypothetical protein
MKEMTNWCWVTDKKKLIITKISGEETWCKTSMVSSLGFGVP